METDPSSPPASEDAASFELIHVVKMPVVSEFGYRGQMGDIIELNDGRLLMAYRGGWWGGKKEPIYTRTSEDGGRTWSENVPLVPQLEPGDKAYYGHPGFARLDNGDILLTYIYASHPYAQNYYRRSRDDGLTWGDQLAFTPYPGYNIVHNDKLTELSTGRLVAPVAHELHAEGGDHRGYVSYTFHSDDQGYNWYRSRNEANLLPIEFQEPHVVELKDGRLLMLGRTYSGFVVRAFSNDAGETWTGAEPMRYLKLSKTSSAINVKRIPATGHLLLLRTIGEGAAGNIRSPFVAAVSQDEGETWKHERVIAGDPEDDYGYPSLTFLKDNRTALVMFHARDGLHLARIPVDWFYQQRLE